MIATDATNDATSIPQLESWQRALENIVTSPAELFDMLALDQHDIEALNPAHAQFPLRVTREYISRIKPGRADDPLLKQILPSPVEMEKVEGFVADPLRERDANPCEGLLHKYKTRALFIVATQCAINCRYCFRRHFPYSENKANRAQWRKVLAYIRQHTEINEVIFSGGDPLVVSDRQLGWLAGEIAQIPHVTRLRIHTRLPLVLPSRICDSLLSWLTDSRLNMVVVVHCNHPQEIDEDVTAALKRLRNAGVTVLNQAVLLKGINDDVKTLVQLSEKLFAASVLPYYLYVLDPVAGAAHFDLDEKTAISLHDRLLAELPGFLVPKLMREIPGRASKIPVVSTL